MEEPKFKVGDIIVWIEVIDKPLLILDIAGDSTEGYQYDLQNRGWYNCESVDKTAKLEE